MCGYTGILSWCLNSTFYHVLNVSHVHPPVREPGPQVCGTEGRYSLRKDRQGEQGRCLNSPGKSHREGRGTEGRGWVRPSRHGGSQRSGKDPPFLRKRFVRRRDLGSKVRGTHKTSSTSRLGGGRTKQETGVRRFLCLDDQTGALEDPHSDLSKSDSLTKRSGTLTKTNLVFLFFWHRTHESYTENFFDYTHIKPSPLP